jgi:voltage-gated sodium channel type II alpha
MCRSPNSLVPQGSRHSSYNSHAARMSYTSHGDLLGGLVGSGKMTKESQLRSRSMRNAPPAATNSFFEITHKAHRGDYVSTVKLLNQRLF